MFAPNSLLLGEKMGVAVCGAYGECVSQPLLPVLMWVFFSFAQCL